MQTQWAHSTITRWAMPSPWSHRLCPPQAVLTVLFSAAEIRLVAVWFSRCCMRRRQYETFFNEAQGMLQHGAVGLSRGGEAASRCGSPIRSDSCFWSLNYGASRETRTLTLLPTADFESAASTDSAIEAQWRRSIGMHCGAVNRLAWSE